jgi:predicted TIM-barrel fold metal-dependent hydrolase
VRVIDADSHIFEPDDLYRRFAPPHLRHLIPPKPEYGLLEGATPLGPLYAGRAAAARPTETGSAEPNAGHDASARLRDMAKEGISHMVCFPSVVTSVCRYPPDVEEAMLAAYNAWVADLCSGAPGKLFAALTVPLRDTAAATRQIQQWAQHPAIVGITIPTRIEGLNLDSEHFDPVWTAAARFDLPILVHSGTARPPYPLGTELQGDNFFLMHLMHHPTEQMLALSALIGGGVMERYPEIRWGFFEAGCGWVPWYLERIESHLRSLPWLVSSVKIRSQEFVLARSFFSCDPGECSLAHYIRTLGADSLLYASDYPHWDSSFPHSVSLISRSEALSTSEKERILCKNALRLYPKIASTLP